MKFNLEELFQILRKYQADIILFIGVILISLLSFAIGFIVAKQQEKEPIKIEKSTNIEYITNKRIYEYSLIRIFETDSLFVDDV